MYNIDIKHLYDFYSTYTKKKINVYFFIPSLIDYCIILIKIT